MEKYVVISLMEIFWINPSDKLIQNSICIIFWRKMCMMSIKEEIIPSTPLRSSRPLLVIIVFSRNVDFGDTREVLLIGP